MIAEADVEGGEPLPSLVDHVRSQWLVAISLAAILAIAVAVRVAWVAYVNVHPFDGRMDDTVFYFASARSLADALEYRDQFGRFSAHWPPGYPLTLAAAFFAAGSHLAGLASADVPTVRAAGVLVWSLVPISLAYHFAHYLTAL